MARGIIVSRKSFVEIQFCGVFYNRQKLHTGKNQKSPFYQNKGINTHLLAEASSETSMPMTPALEMGHSPSITQRHLYPKGLAGTWEIVIRKPRSFLPPHSHVQERLTSLKTSVCQTGDRTDGGQDKTSVCQTGE